MPDPNSPKLTMGEDDFPAMRSESSENPPTRGWTCPDDLTIAAYVDNALSQTRKARVELHLSKCERCRVVVTDVVKLQREIELPVPPFEFARIPVQLAPAVSERFRWIWAPAAAAALLFLITVTISLLREPQKLLVASPPLPSAPMIAKAAPLTSRNTPLREILRKPQLSEALPLMLSPRRDSAVGREQLEFSWTPVSRSRYYEISVVTSDGDLLWEGQTEKSVLHLPSEVVLKRGSYFVWVTAYLADGRVAKSSPVRFVVKG
jgi:Putative zinc-finger